MTINKEVQALEKYRKKKQISIYNLCKLLEIDKISYWRWVNERAKPMPAHKKRIKELLKASVSKQRIQIDSEQEKLFFDWLLYRRDIVFGFDSIPSLEKKMKHGDKSGVIHSYFNTSDVRKIMPELDDDGIYTLLDDLSNLGKIKVWYIGCEPNNFIYDVSFRTELGQAIKTISTNFNYEPMRFNETYQHPRLFKDKPLTEKEKQSPEVILNVKEEVEKALKDGFERIDRRHPKTREVEILKELRKLERDHKLNIDRAILKIAEDKK